MTRAFALGLLIATTASAGALNSYEARLRSTLHTWETPNTHKLAHSWTFGGLPGGTTAGVERFEWGTTAVSWEPGGQRLTGLQDALVNETFHFDARGRLDSIGNGFGPVRLYEFDDRDNPISESAGGLKRQFGYDDNDRLVATREWDGTLSALTLTADGSRSTETVFPPSTPWGVLPSAPGFLSKKRFDYGPNSGALEAVVDITNAASPVPLASWSYDSAGRATSRSSGGSTVSMQWDVFDRLVSGGGARFEYDGFGLRRAAVDGNGTRHFTYVGESLLAEDSALTASVAGFKVGMGGVRFGHDALGSVVQQASVSASSSASFSAWGKPLSGPQLTDVAFTGHLSESNLPAYDAQQRWLDKDFGVFLSRDSVGASSYLSSPNGIGPHSYANLSPGRFADPDGRGAGEFYVGCVNGFGADLGFDTYGKETVRSPAGSYFPFKEVPRWPNDPDEFSGFTYCRFFAFTDRTKIDRAAADRDSQLPAPLADRYRKSQAGTDTREWWYAGNTRQQFIGGVFGSVSGATGIPLPGTLPYRAQESAEMMRFSVAGASAVVAALSGLSLPTGPGGLAMAGVRMSTASTVSASTSTLTAAITSVQMTRAADSWRTGKKKCRSTKRAMVSLPAAAFTKAEQAELKLIINETNQALKKSPGIVGANVKYSSYQSKKYVQATYYPEQTVREAIVSDLEDLFGFEVEIDEIKPRFLGGKQELNNQRELPSKFNSYLGQAEAYGTKGLPDGTCIEGFDLEFK